MPRQQMHMLFFQTFHCKSQIKAVILHRIQGVTANRKKRRRIYIQTKSHEMRKIFLLLTMAIGAASLNAQERMDSLLRSMPETMAPYLSAAQRDELSKFTSLGDTIKVKNSLNGFTSIDSISNDFARISLNEGTELQIRLFNEAQTGSKVVCVIKTIKKPVAESAMRFYDTKWKVIKSNFGLPTFTDRVYTMATLTQRPDTMTEDRFKDLQNCIDPFITNADMSAHDGTITYNLSIPFNIHGKKEEIKAILRQKTFKWNGEVFKEH